MSFAGGLGIPDKRMGMEAQMTRAIRISLAMVASVCLLAACQKDQPSISTSNIPPRQVSLLEGRVVVLAPKGYCVDQDSMQDHRQSGFVLIAGCDGLMGLPSGTLIEPAVLTVAAYHPDLPVSDPLDVAGALDGAQVLEQRQTKDLTLLHLQAPDIVPDESASEHWRGAMVVNGAVLTLAIYGNGAIAVDAGADLLQVLARQIRDVSRTDGSGETPNTPKKPKNLFQRIFN